MISNRTFSKFNELNEFMVLSARTYWSRDSQDFLIGRTARKLVSAEISALSIYRDPWHMIQPIQGFLLEWDGNREHADQYSRERLTNAFPM